MPYVLLVVFALAACGGPLHLNNDSNMTLEEMEHRASHIFVGVIESQELDYWTPLRVPPGEFSQLWKVLRRTVRVETVARGVETRPSVDIYEIFWTGAATGDWNLTAENGRYLFLVRPEYGRYHVVRDFRRSIFAVRSGPHDRLPLDESSPFWERFALLTWWFPADHGNPVTALRYADPIYALKGWRTSKILRGLLRHSDARVRLAACESLVNDGHGQDECWESMLESNLDHLKPSELKRLTESREWNQEYVRNARQRWDKLIRHRPRSWFIIEELRFLTTINEPRLRRRFCDLFQQQFPGDTDHGCPAHLPPPATIVTANGDVPLRGPWPGGSRGD